MKKFTLPREFAQKWVDALRSGEYEQCKDSLHNGVGYCCLGVAGICAGIDKDELLMKIRFCRYEDPVLLKTDLIPIQLCFQSVNGLDVKLSDLNDLLGKNFCEIADWIEENVNFI